METLEHSTRAVIMAAGMACASFFTEPEEGDLKLMNVNVCTCGHYEPKTVVFELQPSPIDLKWQPLCAVGDFARLYPDRLHEINL